MQNAHDGYFIETYIYHRVLLIENFESFVLSVHIHAKEKTQCNVFSEIAQR